jgi:hypothetical protein
MKCLALKYKSLTFKYQYHEFESSKRLIYLLAIER